MSRAGKAEHHNGQPQGRHSCAPSNFLFLKYFNLYKKKGGN